MQIYRIFANHWQIFCTDTKCSHRFPACLWLRLIRCDSVSADFHILCRAVPYRSMWTECDGDQVLVIHSETIASPRNGCRTLLLSKWNGNGKRERIGIKINELCWTHGDLIYLVVMLKQYVIGPNITVADYTVLSASFRCQKLYNRR